MMSNAMRPNVLLPCTVSPMAMIRLLMLGILPKSTPFSGITSFFFSVVLLLLGAVSFFNLTPLASNLKALTRILLNARLLPTASMKTLSKCVSFIFTFFFISFHVSDRGSSTVSLLKSCSQSPIEFRVMNAFWQFNVLYLMLAVISVLPSFNWYTGINVPIFPFSSSLTHNVAEGVFSVESTSTLWK